MRFTLCLVAATAFAVADALPARHGSDHPVLVRVSRSPGRAMMLSGFYGRPSRRQGFEGAMTAFAAGDTVETGSFLGQQSDTNCKACGELLDMDEDNLTEDEPGPMIPDPIEDDVRSAEGKEVGNPKAPADDDSDEDDDDDDDDDDDTPFFMVKGKPGANVFFPMMFGGNFGRSADGLGGPTAIANSFSTGRGGSAISTATAYGESHRNVKKQ